MLFPLAYDATVKVELLDEEFCLSPWQPVRFTHIWVSGKPVARRHTCAASFCCQRRGCSSSHLISLHMTCESLLWRTYRTISHIANLVAISSLGTIYVCIYTYIYIYIVFRARFLPDCDCFPPPPHPFPSSNAEPTLTPRYPAMEHPQHPQTHPKPAP